MVGKKTLETPTPSDVTAGFLRIKAWFFAYPDKEFTLNDLCKATETSKSTSRLVVEDLLARGFITRTIIGKLWRLAANLNSSDFLRSKIAYNLSLIYESKLVDHVLQVYPQARAIILFGSFRKGDDVSTSDVDIALEIPGLQAVKIITAVVLNPFGYRQNVPVNLHLFSRDHVDLNVFANIANGIVLEGFLEVRP